MTTRARRSDDDTGGVLLLVGWLVGCLLASRASVNDPQQDADKSTWGAGSYTGQNPGLYDDDDLNHWSPR